VWSETVKVVRKSDKAVLVEYCTVEAWIPFSQILDDSEIYNVSEPGDEGKLCLPEWLAEKKGLVI
jgi:hypothetical protein